MESEDSSIAGPSRSFIQEGHSVLLQLPSGEIRNVKLGKNTTISFGKYGSFNSSALIGQPYGLTYEIVEKKLKILPPKSMNELEDTDATNEYITDGNIVQPLTSLEIEALKRSGVHASEIIRRQIEQHANYTLKTEYSKEKYKKRKEAKFSKMFATIEPTLHNVCNYWFNKDRSRIREIRPDTLAQMMNFAGVRPGGRYLVVDEASGLLVSAVLERLGDEGRIITVCDVESPPAYPIMSHMNFDEDVVNKILSSLNWATADEDHTPIVPPFEPESGVYRSERQKSRYNKRKKVVGNLFSTRDELFAGEFDALLVASDYEPFSIVEKLCSYLAGSASIVIHSPFIQALAEVQARMKPLPEYLNPSITEGWLRQYQVLPGRTHPVMTTPGSGGYVLHTTRIYDDPNANAVVYTRSKGKKRKRESSTPALSLEEVESQIFDTETSRSSHHDKQMDSSDDEFLDSILRETNRNEHVLPDEYARLTTLFAPTTQSATRARAFVVLSSICHHHRHTSPVLAAEDDPGTHNILHLFLRSIEGKLADVEERSLLEALSFVAALFAVDWRTAAALFRRDGFQDSMMDSLELFPSSAQLAAVVASVLASSCGYKSCRECLSPQCTSWLETTFRHSIDIKLRAAVSLALLKSLQEVGSGGVDVANVTNNFASADQKREELFTTFRDTLVRSESSIRDMADTVEGLAYLSTIPTFKSRIADDDELLKKIISFRSSLERKVSSVEDFGTIPFGLAALIANLCSYRPHLTEEQAQIERLKRMAQPNASRTEGNKKQSTSSEESDDEHVRSRAKRLVAAGAPELLVSITRATDSELARAIVGKAFLGLIEDKENRGRILQSGGAKALMTIIRASRQYPDSQSTNSSKKASIEYADLISIQALAKLAITASPMQVFGPDENHTIEAIRPLAFILQHSSSTLLQRFEALMALTNIASASPELADRVAHADAILGKLEFLFLDENQMVRRAATELTCNLVSGSELVFNRFSGDGGDSSESSKLSASKSRLHVLIALADVDDEPTRLAASGALAALTGSPTACRLVALLEFEHHRVFLILKSLIDATEDEERGRRNGAGSPGLVHRGVVCIRNIFMNLSDDELRNKIASEAVRHGIVNALTDIVRSAGQNGVPEAVLRPTAEVLKWLMDSGAPSKKAGKKGAAAPKNAFGGASTGKFAKADWKEGFKKKQVGVSDMTLLTQITNEAINDNLEKRWKNGDIYTYIGSVLISVNPFRDLGIYTDSVLQSYKGKNRLEMPPHVYSIAESAYYNMNAYHENQCVIITGESGAGKTEAAKRIMQYIAAVSGGEDSSIQEIKDMVLATNPLLESFGCAKTLRNNNSSRHGKYLEIMFNERGEPIGAQITNYLLEKGRVVQQIDNERDFHIFYQFTKAASPDQREMFGIQGPDAYAYISRSGCLDVQDIDDTKDFNDTIKAMQVIGLTQHEQSEIFRVLAIILWLGNVQFVEKDDGNSQIADPSVTDFVAYLMEVDPAMVRKVLTTKVVETQRGGRRGSIYDVPLNPAQANSGRDALAKAIYNNLFEWIVSRVNVSMKPRSATAQLVGILDIYGFEIFEDNSFEQLCINYVNEKLQQIFIELTLKTEQEEYVREQIKWTPIKFFNNKVVCDLIEERRPPGIFAALNDACATAHADPTAADNSFIQRLSALSSNLHFESRGAQFLVKHYAGDVMYNVAGMTDKNKDTLVKDLLDLVASSSNQFLQTLFPDRPDPNSKKRPPTAGDRIKQSAGALVENLMRAQPSYIRTIKPNQNRSPTEYDTKAVLHQIKYLGLQENIRVRRAGFAYRNTFEKVIERFYLLSPATSYAGDYIWTRDARSGCERILADTGIAREEWQMGVTKAFIKNPETLFALEHMRDRYWHNMAARIQRAWRNYQRYRNECATRIQRFWKNNKESIAYAQVRDYGHQILAGRKERRRFSLLSYRRFMGDYLDVGGKSALGEELREVCGIAPNEKVAFSSRIQLLVSKFGRSSKPSPRFLVVTSKAVHILITTAKDESTVTSLERKIPLITIKSIAMSNLRDDWVALNCTISEEGDPVFSCAFKTELTTHLLQLTQASINVLIGPTIDYAKKKDKRAQIKFVKDETVPRDDVYKSHTVHVPSGEPPNSLSRPPAKRKPGVVRPITQGKLLRAGGPDKPKTTSRPRPAAQSLPGKAAAPPPSIRPAPAAAAPSAMSAPKPAVQSFSTGAGVPPPPPPPPPPGKATAPVAPPQSSAKVSSPPAPASLPVRAAAPPAPPPPPPPPEEPEVQMYKARFAFEGQPGEMSLQKGDLVELVEKDDNGWWLVKKNGEEGWTPSNYLEFVPPKPKAVHTHPPPPPAGRRPPPVPGVAPESSGPAVRATPLRSVAADANAKPVAVFPGMAPANGSAAPWRKNISSDSNDTSPGNSRPTSVVGSKPVPAIAAKPKPAPPPVASKPKVPGKPPIPTAPRPVSGVPSAPSRPGGGVKPPPGAAPGQMDLAAALARRAQRIAEED
ncbi:MYO1_1 [Sanghuangporus sanghuang]